MLTNVSVEIFLVRKPGDFQERITVCNSSMKFGVLLIDDKNSILRTKQAFDVMAEDLISKQHSFASFYLNKLLKN